MNAEEAGLLWQRKADVEAAGGIAAHRLLALKHLQLKTVVKVHVIVWRQLLRFRQAIKSGSRQ